MLVIVTSKWTTAGHQGVNYNHNKLVPHASPLNLAAQAHLKLSRHYCAFHHLSKDRGHKALQAVVGSVPGEVLAPAVWGDASQNEDGGWACTPRQSSN